MPRGRRWSEWAKEGRSQTIAPWARVPRQAGEWRGWRSLTDPGGRHCPPSGGCGRARAVARRAASSGPARAACILPGPAGCGGPSWAAPPQQGGSPQLGTEALLEHRAPGARCWEPAGAWLDVPVGPGGPSGAGLRLLEEGDPLGRGPSPGRAAGLAKPRNSASAQGSWSAWRSGSRVRVQGFAGLLGQSRGPGVSEGSRVMLGTRGAQGSQGCAALQGARSGTSAAEGAAGRGSALRCPAAPEPGSEGRRAAARPLPGLRHAAPRPGGRERGGRESGAEPGRAGGWGRRAGEGRTRRGGRGGRGRGGPGRAAGSRSELGARARRGGVCRAWQALAGSALALSLVPSHARGGRRSPQQPLPNFPNFPAQLFPLLPCLRLPPPPSPFPSPALRWAVAPERHRQRASGLMLCSGDPRLRGGSPMVRQLWGHMGQLPQHIGESWQE